MSTGANFVRADLHIHSFGEDVGSFDVKDEQMTPENIVDTAIEKNLKIISVTDHNVIRNSKRAISYSTGKDILVIPGVELSTPQGHLLIYAPDFEALERFYGKLTISSDKKTCNQSIIDCLEFAKNEDCIAVLAHIDISSGFEQTIGKFNEHFENIVTHETVYGLEITRKESAIFYTEDDEETDTGKSRKSLIRKRREKLDLENDYDFPKIMSSDSHQLSKLGLNAEGNKRLTRFKVDDLTFHSLKVALLHPQSRVKIEEFIPERIAKFISLKFEGGLLDGQEIHFNRNLNCIIGGRGAGKSTLLESLRTVSGNPVKESDLIDCDIWSHKIALIYEDEAGNVEKLERSSFSDVINISNSDSDALIRIPIESYGQGTTAETIQHSDKDPHSLLEFLDSFIDLNQETLEDKAVCESLIENKSDVDRLRIEVTLLSEYRRKLADLRKKMEAFKKEKVGDLVKLQESLDKEKDIRSTVVTDLKELIRQYREILSDDDAFKKFDEIEEEDISIGKNEFLEVKRIVSEFSDIVSKHNQDLDTELSEKITSLNTQLKGWRGKEKEIQDQINEKKKEYDKKGILFDHAKIIQISNDIVLYEKRINELLKKVKLIDDLNTERRKLVVNRKKIKDRIFQIRNGLAITLNNKIAKTVDELLVHVKFYQGNLANEFVEHLKSTMGYRTSQVSKAEAVSSKFDPITFAKIIKNKQISRITSIKDKDDYSVFNNGQAEELINKYNERNLYEELHHIGYEDKPQIQITKVVNTESGMKTVIKTLAQLSLGQQQSILLAILLQSNSNIPLLIDQPEDNLDSEFIYKTIVKNLKKIKETRQVILVTHNANIAVLGDTELLIPLKSTNDKSMVMDSGSIDNEKTKKLACEILEGGERAFKKRKEIYGF